MKYLQIPGEPDAIVWQDDTGSGVVRAGDDGWEEYQLWLDEGNVLESIEPKDSRPLEELRRVTLMAINASIDQAMQPMTNLYPRAEIDSWAEQSSEVRAWLNDQNASTPLIDAITGPLDATAKQAFCDSVLARVAAFNAAIGAAIAWRRAMTVWVSAQTDRDTLIGFTPMYPEVPHD